MCIVLYVTYSVAHKVLRIAMLHTYTFSSKRKTFLKEFSSSGETVMTEVLIFLITGVFSKNPMCHLIFTTYLFITVIIVVRESRLRHHLGVRYDSRSGVYDWDYHMKLQEMVTIS